MSHSRRAPHRAYRIELVLPVLVILVIGLGWSMSRRYENTVEEAVIASYQETQLEIVRALARSAMLYAQDELAKGTDIKTIEQTIFKRFVAPTRLLGRGDAWIYAPDHIVFDESEDLAPEYRGKSIAEIFAMQQQHGASHYADLVDDVTQAREGVGWYIYLPDKGREIGAWTPVRIANYVWTIGLSTPLSDILQASGAADQLRFLFGAMLVATLLVLGMTGLATRSLLRHRRMELELAHTNDTLAERVDALRREVEERERAERSSRESEEKYRILFETATDGILVLSAASRVLDANPAVCTMYDRTRDELLALDPQDLFHSDYRAVFTAFVAAVQQGQSFRGEAQGVRRDGSLLATELVGSSYGLGGERYLLLNIRDITARIAAEREKQELEVQLARSRKMEALGLLAGGVAHDLNNILGSIVSLPDLLIADLNVPAGSEPHELLETMKESGTRAAAVISDLMSVARGIASTREVVSWNDIISQYLLSGEHRELKERFPTVVVKTQLDPELRNLKGAPISLKQALINLVVNAAEAIKDAGTIVIATCNRKLERPLQGYHEVRAGEYVVLTISDTGSGIAAEDLERIFEPFYSRKKLGRSGTGLGLAVVWNAVQDHEGSIDVKSSPAGTTFELYIPVTHEALATRSRTTSLSELLGSGEHILVVDDEPSQREIASKILRTLGYRVATVASGEQAIQYVKTQPVALLVLDMIMEPGISGRQTYEQIVKLCPSQKAIIASGYSESEDVRIAQKLGAGEYVKKPYTMEKLSMAVKLELHK